MHNATAAIRHAGLLLAGVTLLGTISAACAAAAPAVGTTYVYLVTNGYSKEARGRLTFQVEKVDANSITYTVTPDAPSLGQPHSESYLPNGNWLRRPVASHDRPVDYDFVPAYPAYEFPLEPGRRWSTRVIATNAANGRQVSVRVDGTVLGAERIRVPAGEFDTIKVHREVYPGDQGDFLSETHLTETDWYAPQLGRAVKTESRSEWLDRSRPRNRTFYGDWNIAELAGVSSAQH
jgi:hypothetical protein